MNTDSKRPDREPGQWMVTVRWLASGAGRNAPPAGELLPLTGVSEACAREYVAEMKKKLHPGSSTVYRAVPIAEYVAGG